jgi:DNA-3-methyladenine glycosylase
VARKIVPKLDFLNGRAVDVAKALLGCTVVGGVSGEIVVAKIVETEAYDQTDAASHSYNGVTPRTEIMFGPAGHLYVYFTYGMHYCCNVVVGENGYGAAVLIRAVEPLEGKTIMAERRHQPINSPNLTNGPAKFAQAFGINKSMNGHNLLYPPLALIPKIALSPDEIILTTRIGISKAKDLPWRFVIAGSPYVSKS